MYTALETSHHKVLKVIYFIPQLGYHSVLDQIKKKVIFFLITEVNRFQFIENRDSEYLEYEHFSRGKDIRGRNEK